MSTEQTTGTAGNNWTENSLDSQGLYDALGQICETDNSARRRAEYSSDASNYRVVPQVVTFPRSKEDVIALHAVSRQFGVPITARGAGTSVAGNAVGPGIIIDYSRYMNQIIEIDADTQTARIQPGVIMSDLQKAAAPFGLWFGPDPSTKNRATLGGMIGNNACGPHALAYGRTADNVVELEVLDGHGRLWSASSGSGALDAVPGLQQLVMENLSTIRTELGRFTRQVSGYSLEHLLPENGSDLAKALVGSEGTCVSILEATVKLQPVPTSPILVVLGYPDMPSAADDVPNLLDLDLLAIEGMDARLVEVVRRHHGSVPQLPDGAGWLFCEVGGKTPEEAMDRAHQLVQVSASLADRIVTDPNQAAALWRIRADGVGLAGRTPGGRPAWPGWEDAAVPPKYLGQYLRDFDALMAKYEVDGLAYGHFGDGCVHIRIDWPLDKESDVPVFGNFLDDAAQLVASFGGSLSGEHGDGRARSGLLHHIYSPETVELFAQFKALFDPQNLLNPGVLVSPDAVTANLRRPAAKSLGAKGFAFTEDSGDMTKAIHRCVGVGKCRANNFVTGGFMCPSYQATGDEKDATRARARLLQEVANGTLITDWDSPALAQSLDLCLSCKACGHDCPAGVDMAKYKSEAIFRRYKGKLRPMNHYVLGWLPRWSQLVTWIPPVAWAANGLMQVAPLRKAVFAVAGLDGRRQMTAFATQRFSRWFKKNQGNIGEESLPAAGNKKASRDVIIWADSFSEYLDPSAAQAMVRLLEDAGYRVRIPSGSACCGLTWISTGQLDGAKARLSGLLDVLGPAAEQGVPIIGVEPSCTAVLRDDLVELLPEDPRAHAVAASVKTLAELLTDPEIGPGKDWQPSVSLDGVDIIAQPHCHQHSVMGFEPDVELLRRLGANVQQLNGCCGLAGNFGMEKGHYEVSVAVAENGLIPALKEASPETVFLADGYSCRTQASQLAGVEGISLPQLLAGANWKN